MITYEEVKDELLKNPKARAEYEQVMETHR